MHIVFVCWGNICRSPAAEATFRKLLAERKLNSMITCDSQEPFPNIREILRIPECREQPEIEISKPPARPGWLPIKISENADLLITMDNFNYNELSRLAPDEKSRDKIKPFCDFVSSSDSEVPDPYYGGSDG